MDNRPIGILDSGLGGLTVARELRRLLPGEDIVYLGDTGRAPYGIRSRETVRAYAAAALRFLLTRDVKAVLVACDAVSANFSEKDVQALALRVPYSASILPAARTACALSSQRRIGVIATPAGIRGGAYGKAVRAIAPGVKLIGNACPLLTPLALHGLTGEENEIARLTVEMYLAPLIAEDIDTLILGCDHYTLFRDLINNAFGYGVTLIGAGEAAVRELKATLLKEGLTTGEERAGKLRCYLTDLPDGTAATAALLLGEEPDELLHAELARPTA